MKTIPLLVIVLVTIGVLSLQRVTAKDVAPKQFTAKFVITETKNGKDNMVGAPTLMMAEGQQASFLIGGEVPVYPDANEYLSYGLQVRIKVREMAADKLRVSIYAGQSDMAPQGESDFLIHEQGVHCVKTIKPGEHVQIDLGGKSQSIRERHAGRKQAVDY